MRRFYTILILAISLTLSAQENITITNSTDSHDALVIAEIIAYELMEFDTLNVTLFPLPKGTKLEGALDKNQYEPHTYVLLVNESMSLKRLIVMIAHEFIHIQQYENEGLEIFGDIWVWNPDGIKEQQNVTWGSMAYTDYSLREFENDAFRRQYPVAKKVSKALKNKNLIAKMK